MAGEHSAKAYDYWRQASEKFDYFVTGLSGALVAYIGQTIEPHRIGLSAESAELAALGLLAASVVAGFKRIETNVTFLSIMQKDAKNDETKNELRSISGHALVVDLASGLPLSPGEIAARITKHEVVSKAAEEKLDELKAQSVSWYRWRNRLLMAGFAALVIAKLLPAYL
jgi:hypothetical protein